MPENAKKDGEKESEFRVTKKMRDKSWRCSLLIKILLVNYKALCQKVTFNFFLLNPLRVGVRNRIIIESLG
jgi:hypothetical protein